MTAAVARLLLISCLLAMPPGGAFANAVCPPGTSVAQHLHSKPAILPCREGPCADHDAACAHAFCSAVNAAIPSLRVAAVTFHPAGQWRDSIADYRSQTLPVELRPPRR